jgi:predicted protein tyrosine phosphatase
MNRINVLFVCSRNQWRSPTAERVFRDDPRMSVRARGLSSKSSQQLGENDLSWANIIFVMENKHRSRITRQFRDAIRDTQLHVLEIPDDYEFMDSELIEVLQDRVEAYFRDQET